MILTVRRRHPLFVHILLWLGIQIPFLPTAFRIDEPYYLAIAKQIRLHPLDPYGFHINWLGTPRQVSETFANPPLVPLWVAAWSTVFPLSEFSTHVSMLLFGLLAIHGLVLLAEQYNVDQSLSVQLLCYTPAFFLGTQVVMLDVPMLSLLLLAMAYALLYEETGRKTAWGIAFASAFFCPLTKYNGLLLVLLLGCLFIRCRRRIGMLLLTLAPVSSFLLWNIFTWIVYGKPNILLLFELGNTLEKSRVFLGHEMGIFISTGLGAVCLVIPLLLFPTGILKKTDALGILIVFALSFWWAQSKITSTPMGASLAGLGVSVIFMIIAVGFRQFWEDLASRDHRSLLLGLWFFLGLMMQFALAATSVRYALVVTPPVILITLKILKSVKGEQNQGLRTSVILMAILFSVCIAIGDAKIANGYRDFISRRLSAATAGYKGQFYFAGHWGFQYYAEQAGGVPLDVSKPQYLKPHDFVVVAHSAWPGILSPQLVSERKLETTFECLAPGWPVNTITCSGGANFYGNRLANCERPTVLPFALGQFNSETFSIEKVLDSGAGRNPAFISRLENE